MERAKWRAEEGLTLGVLKAAVYQPLSSNRSPPGVVHHRKEGGRVECNVWASAWER